MPISPVLKITWCHIEPRIPTAMLPITPNESSYMVQNQEIPQPFSDQIYKAGVSISMPIFIKSIYTTASKAKHLQ